MKDIAKKSNTQYLLDKYKLQASKKFGQNFLIDLSLECLTAIVYVVA